MSMTYYLSITIIMPTACRTMSADSVTSETHFRSFLLAQVELMQSQQCQHTARTVGASSRCALLEAPQASAALVLFLAIGSLEPLGGPRLLGVLRPASLSAFVLAGRVEDLIEVHTGRPSV